MKAAAVVRTALQGQQRHTDTARRINSSSYGRYSSNLLSNFHPTVLSKCDDEEKRRHDDTVAATAFHSRGFCQSLLPQLLSTRLLSHHYHDSHSNFSSLSTRRQFHTTPTPERYAAIVMTLGAIAATAKAGQYAVQGYNEWKEAAAAQQQQQEMEERGKMEQQGKEGKEDTTFTAEGGNTSGASFSDSRTGDDAQSKGEEKTTEGRRENIFASFFDMAIGSKYYEGGFEEKMTRKEAALILGVRESSTPKRIKEAHRKLLMLNHPDTGGSTFIAGKVNEAKELLLKGRKH